MCYAGLKNGKDGYEGLIEAALAISGLFKVDQQWQTVATALERAFPSYILTMASIFILWKSNVYFFFSNTQLSCVSLY